MLKQLLGLSPDQILSEVLNLGLPRYTSKQISEWIYKKRVLGFRDMTNISLKNRELLDKHLTIGAKQPEKYQISVDGTIKYLYQTSDNKGHESVYIPDNDRATLCISSQVGCKFNCSFCLTGRQGFQANLTAGEILNQVYSLPQFEQLTNIVFMGMGEPLDNLDEVLRACNALTSEWGFALSPRRITISTIGIISKLPRLIEESNCHIAISLHSPFDKERQTIMPVQKSNDIKQVINLLRTHNWQGQRRLSFEYIMFDGLNDTDRHINALINLLKGLHCRINLIRYHQNKYLEYRPSTDEKMIYFRDKLTENHIITTIRTSRGQDISAACGMLSYQNSKNESDKK